MIALHINRSLVVLFSNTRSRLYFLIRQIFLTTYVITCLYYLQNGGAEKLANGIQFGVNYRLYEVQKVLTFKYLECF